MSLLIGLSSFATSVGELRADHLYLPD